MFFEPRISQQELALVCRRVGTALAAGVDILRVWEREGQGHGPSALRSRVLGISDELIRGKSLGEALQTTGSYFPPLVHELVRVGEQTGNLAEVLISLADHYDHQVQLRRAFLTSITWPMFQLFAALGVIGLVIWIMGFLPTANGQQIDILGLGLVGESGLLIYVCFLGAVAGVIFWVYQAMRRGMLWTRGLERLVQRIPVIGRFLEILALSRLAWTMHLTFNTSMDLRAAIPLCLRSTHHSQFIEAEQGIVEEAVSGRPLYESFAQAGVFPGDFLDALDVGERTGRIPESMAHLAEQYRDQARRMMQTLTVAGGFAVGALVGLMIIGVIVMMLKQTLFPYYDTINELTR